MRQFPLWSTQVVAFVIVGALQLLVDWAIFVALTYYGVPVATANFTGRLTGAALGFSLNGMFTFRAGSNGKLTAEQALRFAMFWLAATFVSTCSVYLIGRQLSLQAAWLVKPVIEALLAVISFVVSKLWIYRNAK